MKFGKLLVGTTFSCALCWTAIADEVDDCVLGGLKGVNSDAAARMVRQACENKVKTQRRDELNLKYGSQTTAEMKVTEFEWGNNSRYGSSDAIVTVLNPLPKTAMLIELTISSPDSTGKCTPWSRKMVFLYSLKAKPYQSVRLVAGDSLKIANSKYEVCPSATILRTREPRTWDISIGKQQIISQEELDHMNMDLGERYVRLSEHDSVPAPLPGPPPSSKSKSKSEPQYDVMTFDLKTLLDIAPKVPGK